MAHTSSILRYPGGKAKFAPFIAEALALNKRRPLLFVEPFCGGASVSISLLERDAVDSVALNDSDPLISSLWQVIFSEDAFWLIDQIHSVPLTLDEWKRQKSLVPANIREGALKALYLNRTSFNGILHQAGPIGGWKQDKRTLGVRFNRERLATRVLQLNALKSRVAVTAAQDWRQACLDLASKPGVFFYFDPPYYHKADQLYGHYFDTEQHTSFRDFLVQFEAPWLLSYDDAPEVRKLYRPYKLAARVIDATYSAHPVGGASFVGRELFFSNLKKLPGPSAPEREHVGITVKKYRRNQVIQPMRTPFATSEDIAY